MIIYPAIDIKEGKCVRLQMGKYDKVTVYSDDPVHTALRWKFAGAENIHIVDLDGARSGMPVNADLIKKIAQTCGMKVQAGGGIRTMESIREILGAGISRVVIGTAAIKEPGLIRQAVLEFGEQIAVGIDARDGKAAADGWETTSRVDAFALAGKVENLGVKTIIYTDISRDGMLKGPNTEAMEKMKKATGMKVIASGGVSSVKDIVDLKNCGLDGVIIGKALYTGAIDLGEAIKIAEIV